MKENYINEENYINVSYDVDFLIHFRKIALSMFHINMCGCGPYLFAYSGSVAGGYSHVVYCR